MDRRHLLKAMPLAVAGLTPWPSLAQSYPARPVMLLVGAPPGTVPDVMVRPIAERLAAQLGQAVVVENRPGAGGAVAMGALARSAPDGYTIALATMSQAVFNTYLFAKLPYDAQRDLEPVAPLVSGAMALAAHPSFPARTLPQFIALAKSRPGTLFIAIPQLGAPPHIVALLLKRVAGVDVTLVPHKSGADAMNAVMSGEIPLLFDAPTLIAPQVQAGRLRAIAVTGLAREPLLPDTPTASESGLDLRGEAWIGVVAAKGTPAAIVQRLNRELAAIMAEPEMQAKMSALGFRTLRSTPEEFRTLIRDEHLKWGIAIRDAGLNLE